MKPLILFVLTLAAAAQAQQPAPCLKLSKVEIETHVLHRSSGTDVKLTFAGQHCYVFSESPSLGRLLPVIEMQSEPGLHVTADGPELSRFDQTTVSAFIFRAEEVSATLHLAAASDLALGEHKLPGLVRYKTMDGLGNVSDETLAFEFPITIAQAEHMAKIKPVSASEPSFSQRHPIWDKVLLPLKVIVFIPLFILADLVSGSSC
jgi:hypothetical protein